MTKYVEDMVAGHPYALRELAALRAWAARGKWLVDKLTERMTPDGRCVAELCHEPIWIKPDGTLQDYIVAVDLAMSRDESRATA